MHQMSDHSYSLQVMIPEESISVQIHNLVPLSPSNPLLDENVRFLEGFISGVELSTHGSNSLTKPVILAVPSNCPGERRILASQIFIPPSFEDLPPVETKSNMTAHEKRARDKYSTINGHDCCDSTDLKELSHLPTKTQLSMLLHDIHTSIQHKHAGSVRSAVNKLHRSPEEEAHTSVMDVIESFDIDIKKIPEMNNEEVIHMVEKLFGTDPGIGEIFRNEQIDGSSFVLLSMDSFTNFLKLPLGMAITLDGIAGLARKEHDVTLPA